jgi:hypothetical protein
MRFRPCVDLHNGAVKQIVGSTLGDDPTKLRTNFESKLSAAEFAAMYQRDQLVGGHVIMLGPGNEEAALSALAAYPNGLQVGGGVNAGNARRYIDAGASHIIVTSWVFVDGKLSHERLAELVKAVGALLRPALCPGQIRGGRAQEARRRAGPLGRGARSPAPSPPALPCAPCRRAPDAMRARRPRARCARPELPEAPERPERPVPRGDG